MISRPNDDRGVQRINRYLAFFLGLSLGLMLYPLVLQSTVGNHKASSHADAALVLGARVYEDGTPSDALYDRIIAAVELYKNGLCDVFVFSGGPGVEGWTEPQVMRRIAIEEGVPESVIILDEHGLNTAASARNYAALHREHGWESVIAVTHFYHTPRLKLALRREGVDGETHAAIRRGRVLKKLPIFIARESVAWWAYTLGLK